MRHEDNWILPATIIAGLSVLWAAAFAYATGFHDRLSGISSLKISVGVITVTAGWQLIRFIFRLWRAGVPDPIRQIRRNLGTAAANFLPIVIGVAVIGALLSSQTYLKSMIVAVVPFWADAPLTAIDEALHLNPENLAAALQPVMRPLGRFYAFWHAINLGGILWVLHWKGGEKSRLIISYMLTWALGMMLAYVFSSAGPIFTGRFDPQLAPPSVQLAVEFLWTNYKNSGAALGGGISAFPSMHVAIATWFALVLRERRLGWLGIAYVLAIFACSIILGWHYSLDSVAGVVVAIVSWHVAAPIIERCEFLRARAIRTIQSAKGAAVTE